MSLDPPIKSDMDYIRVLAQQVQDVPAWKEMTEAARQIMGAEIDDRRRKLQKMRDSVKYRRGDVLVNVDYEPEPGKPMVDAITGDLFVPDTNSKIQFRTATVKNVIQNLRYFDFQAPVIDYMDLEVVYKGRTYRWMKPFVWNQERDVLLKNAYRLGFNFFNTKLSDQDLQRLNEFIQIYWNEAGSDDNFMKFIGFVKNTRFDLVALWTEGPAEPFDTPGDTKDFQYPYLEPFDAVSMKSVKDGGENWVTSHVEITYDLAQFNKFYIVNLDDLEQLFYYFAPIILVLERISGVLVVNTPVHGIGSVATTSFQPDLLKPTLNFETPLHVLGAVATTSFQPDLLKPTTQFNTLLQAASAASVTQHRATVLTKQGREFDNSFALVNLPLNLSSPYDLYAVAGIV